MLIQGSETTDNAEDDAQLGIPLKKENETNGTQVDGNNFHSLIPLLARECDECLVFTHSYSGNGMKSGQICTPQWGAIASNFRIDALVDSCASFVPRYRNQILFRIPA